MPGKEGAPQEPWNQILASIARNSGITPSVKAACLRYYNQALTS